MLKRLPISLKIDDEDGDFYYGLIEEKRKNRELTTLILNLLKLYHTDENVRKAADDFMVSQNPYLKIHEELQRIAFEHRKQTTSTGMISDFARNEMKMSMEKEQGYEEPEEQSDENKPTMELLMAQISKVVTESVSKALSESQGKETNIAEITNRAMQGVKDTIEGNVPMSNVSAQSTVVSNEPVLSTPVFSAAEPPVVQEVKDKETEQKPKAVPKSFKKMMDSVK